MYNSSATYNPEVHPIILHGHFHELTDQNSPQNTDIEDNIHGNEIKTGFTHLDPFVKSSKPLVPDPFPSPNT